MSDVLDNAQTQNEQPQAEETKRPHETVIESGALNQSFFGIEPVQQTEQKQEEEEKKPEEQPAPEPQKTEWFKNYGWENEDAAKAEIEQLKTLKDAPKTAEEIKFENEQSKQIHELIRQGKTKEVKEFLEIQERLEGFTTGEVSKENADDIIKLGMKLKYKDLTQSEIDYKFNKQYSVPPAPVQRDDELQEEFDARKAQWQEAVRDVEMSKIIDAKLSRPDLEQAKTKLVLPDIQPAVEQEVKLTPEQVEAAKKFDAAYLNSVEQSVKDFSGFSLKVKNEDVGLPEISVAYLAADNEKVSLANELKDWVSKSYDANALFTQRWVNTDGTVNTKQMAEDRYLLANRDAIFQKLAEETAKKSIEAFVKGKKNITIKEGFAAPNNLQSEKTDLDKIREMVFA